MVDIKTLSDKELFASADDAVETEKEAINVTTRHFQEILARGAHLSRYSNMFELLTKRWGYCNGSAQLRIAALQLIRQVPSVQSKIESGEMSMTVAASIQTFLNREKSLKRPYSQNAKIELVEACTGLSKIEAQREFVRRNPELDKHESFRFTSVERVRLDISISAKCFEQIKELQEVLSHSNDAKTMGELIERFVDEAHTRYSPQRKAARAMARKENQLKRRKSRPQTMRHNSAEAESTNVVHPDEVEESNSFHPHPVKRTRYVPVAERLKVIDDGNGCVHVDNESGNRCGSKKFLQLDHIKPFAQGGANAADNLRWMCGAHNRWRNWTCSSQDR